MGRLKIVYPVCCGMDVHHDFVIACVASTNGQGVASYDSKRFSTYSGGLRDLAAWLARHNCKDICMESTGKYWFPVHNMLEKDFNVVAATQSSSRPSRATPQNNESAGNKKTTRIGKAGQYIKPLLLQCAIAVRNPRSKKHSEVLAKYLQLQKRRGTKKARIAIARRLLTAIYQILLKDEPYQPYTAPAKDTMPKAAPLPPSRRSPCYAGEATSLPNPLHLHGGIGFIRMIPFPFPGCLAGWLALPCLHPVSSCVCGFKLCLRRPSSPLTYSGMSLIAMNRN